MAESKTPEIFQYHLDMEIVTINEARKSLGLPPREGGDMTVAERVRAGDSMTAAGEEIAARQEAKAGAEE